VLRTAGLRQLLRGLQDLDRFAKRWAGESGWLAYAIDWWTCVREWHSAWPQAQVFCSREKVQEYLLLCTVIIGKIQSSLGLGHYCSVWD
jgi:hypothetical protein